MLYYRIDLLEKAGLKPPRTWDDYLAVAKALNGKDFTATARPATAPASPRSATLRATGCHRHRRLDDSDAGHSPGHLLRPQGHEAADQQRGFAQGARLSQGDGEYGPPDEINIDVGDTRPLFISGQCALNLDWGDVGVLAIDPKTSKVIDKTGSVITPGTKEVLNWSTGKLEACTKDTCPYAIDGVNHAPFAAFGGWSGGINVKAHRQGQGCRLRLHLLHVAAGAVERRRDDRHHRLQPIPHVALRPTRHVEEAGMSKVAGDNYLGAIKAAWTART